MIKLINRLCIMLLVGGEYVIIKQFDNALAITGYTIISMYAIAMFMLQEKKDTESNIVAMQLTKELTDKGKIKVEEMKNE